MGDENLTFSPTVVQTARPDNKLGTGTHRLRPDDPSLQSLRNQTTPEIAKASG